MKINKTFNNQNTTNYDLITVYPMFIGETSNRARKLTFTIKTECNLDRDVLLRGTLVTREMSGEERVEDIYMYQPVIYAKNGVGIKPSKRNGKLIGNKTYRVNLGDEIAYGYIPKRELLSGLVLDFDEKSAFSFGDRFPDYKYDGISSVDMSYIERFISVRFDVDSDGNYKVVNLEDPKELARFQEYLLKHKNGIATPLSYYSARIREAESQLKYFWKQIKPHYAKAPKLGTGDAIKVEGSRKPQGEDYNWYKRYDYYLNPMFGDPGHMHAALPGSIPPHPISGGPHHGMPPGPGHRL